MATISVAVVVADSPDSSGPKRGDIVSLMDTGHQWTQGELCRYLILEIVLPQNITRGQVAWLTSIYYSGGILQYDGAAETLAKRRFNIDWTKLKTLISQAGITVDWVKVENVNIPYSPLSAQDAAPGGNNAYIDPTKSVNDKYEGRLIKAIDFTTLVG